VSDVPLRHTTVTMTGRDPHEHGRASTPLELLFDLTFVIAFGTAADQLAHFLAEDHLREGIIGFGFATFAISWAWINFSWFASAYDTDDWIYRLTTMVQMVGVIILALGLPAMFSSLEHGDHVDNRVMVLGYVVMRVPMLAQWTRAMRQDPERRLVVEIFVLTLATSQLGWIALALADTGVGTMFAWAALLTAVELVGPLVAEHVRDGTPWHAHHIAERYGLMVIIALGEGLLGTAAALGALIDASGWTVETALLGLAGVAMTFGVWWTYFVVPCGDLLHAYRSRSFGWGYGHVPLFGAIVAIGAGLHAAAYFLEHHSELSETRTLLTVAVPLSIYLLCLYLLYAALTRTIDPFHLLLLGVTGVVVAAALALSATGASITVTLLVLATAPWVTVVGYETIGHRHNASVLAALPHRASDD
jgi:low temperature requirement protein LtrA